MREKLERLVYIPDKSAFGKLTAFLFEKVNLFPEPTWDIETSNRFQFFLNKRNDKSQGMPAKAVLTFWLWCFDTTYLQLQVEL